LSSALNLAKEGFACRGFCKPLSDAHEALWSPSCDSTWSLTAARAASTGGAEKFSSPAGKTFFDTIGHKPPNALQKRIVGAASWLMRRPCCQRTSRAWTDLWSSTASPAASDATGGDAPGILFIPIGPAM
jgi:hypothetical protein